MDFEEGGVGARCDDDDDPQPAARAARASDTTESLSMKGSL
jgi:hypothetical protein